MDYVTGENDLQFYTARRFKKLSARMMFYPTLVIAGLRLANRYPSV